MGFKGFSDHRNAAELTLSPCFPESRSLPKSGGLKLNIGGKIGVPGVISKASDITGAVRGTFGKIIKAKMEAEALSTTLSSTLGQFDALLKQFRNGTLVLPDPLFTANVSVGIPGAESFMQFSTLKPGQTLPASFTALIQERKAKLAALSARISTTFTGTSFSGVNIIENFTRQPFPLDRELDLPSIPRLAMGGAEAAADAILKDKRRFAVAGVHIAAGKPSFWSRLLSATQVKAVPTLNPVVNQIFKDRKNAGSWSEPPSPYAAQYPYNRVSQTESGHVMEWDDTPGAERVHIFHRSGSFIEMHPDGTVVYKNMKDGYLLTMANQYVKVSGACHISVDGNATLHAKGNVEVQSDGEINMTAKKDFNVFAQNINMRAKRTFKGDGTQVDLRYINLPKSLMPVPMGGGFAPRINITAIKADFPGSNITQVMARMAKNPLDPKNANLSLTLPSANVATPPENPLSNPGLYLKKGVAATAYRARLFDTPEETDDTELYSAHIGMQSALGDTTGDPRELGGKLYKLEGPDLTTEKNTPAVDYLNYDTFKGKFDYEDTYVLAGTSFSLRDLVDVALHPDVVSPLKPIPKPPVTPTVETPTGTGGGGNSGGGGGTPGTGGEEVPTTFCVNGSVNFHDYFFSLINRGEGSDASDWHDVLTQCGIPAGPPPGYRMPDDAPHYGMTQQISDSRGVAGRLFLATNVPDDLGYFTSPVDILADGPDGGLIWAWRPWGNPPARSASC